MKIILLQLEIQITNVFFLQPCFFEIRLKFANNSIKPEVKVIILSFLFKISLKSFFSGVLKNLSYL